MSLFGKTKYQFDRSSVARSASKILERGAAMVANLDSSGKSVGERIESMIAKVINEDEDMELIMRRIASKFGIEDDMVVMPVVNDSTLMIDKYVLAVPNGSNVLTPAVEKKDMDEMYNYLISVTLSNDEALMKAFVGAIDRAANGK